MFRLKLRRNTGPFMIRRVINMQINVTFTNGNPNTVYNRLAAKLGREPSNVEVKAELDRILSR